MLRKIVIHLFNLILALLSTLLAFKALTKLPPLIPNHFRFDGTPNGYGSRRSLLVVWAVALVLVGICYLSRWFFRHFLPLTGLPSRHPFFALPPAQQEPFWAVLDEFLAVLALAVQILFAIVQSGMIQLALGSIKKMPAGIFLLTLAFSVVIFVYYLWRLYYLLHREVGQNKQQKEI